MELLKIHKNGQWSLHKQVAPPSPSDGQSTPRIQGQPDADFRAYRSTTGQLREDHGTKGMTHGNPGNKRAPKQGLPEKHWGKPPQLLPSSAANSEPGEGV